MKITRKFVTRDAHGGIVSTREVEWTDTDLAKLAARELEDFRDKQQSRARTALASGDVATYRDATEQSAETELGLSVARGTLPGVLNLDEHGRLASFEVA